MTAGNLSPEEQGDLFIMVEYLKQRITKVPTEAK